MPRLAINHEACMRTGQCYYMHPDLVEADAEDWPHPTQDRYPDEQREALEDVAAICPTSSIAVLEDDE